MRTDSSVDVHMVGKSSTKPIEEKRVQVEHVKRPINNSGMYTSIYIADIHKEYIMSFVFI